MKLKCMIAILLANATLISCSSAPHSGKNPHKKPISQAEFDRAMNTSLDDEETPSGHPAPFISEKTKYQVIQDGYDQSTLMPDISEFDFIDDPSPQVFCVTVKSGSPDLANEFVIKRMLVNLPGTLDYGPLFPGTSDHAETRLVIGKNNGWVNSQSLTNEMRQVFEIARAPGALVIKINENKFGIYQDVGAPAEVWIKKHENGYYFFKVHRVDAARNRNEVFSGYCYRRGGSPVRQNP